MRYVCPLKGILSSNFLLLIDFVALCSKVVLALLQAIENIAILKIANMIF